MRKKTKTITESEETFFIDTQTSYSGKLRWVYKPLYDEPTLQQEAVTHFYENGLVVNAETEWVDVPVERL